MLFLEFAFLPFFLLVFGVYWALPDDRWRKPWLLATSYYFYGCWDWRFLGLLVGTSLVDYFVALALERPGARRRAWLGLSLAANLGVLGFFKYCNFFLESTVGFLHLLGFQAHRTTLEIVLPVGISFYTFQTLSYTLDVYFGNLRARRSLLDFTLYVAFFPQLVAGPIVRAIDFLPQLDEKRLFARVDVRGALCLFLIGFLKKACISDNIASFVDAYFSKPQDYDVASSWLGIVGYAFQVYCDFSGYSDMAIGCAALLGYQLCPNFRYPYFAPDLGELWRRWHISLSMWLRDYVYIPLGGNRTGRARTYRNVFYTLVLCGMWHGAGWTYILFGVLQGIGLCALRARDEFLPSLKPAQPVALWRRLGSNALTFYFFCFSMIIFRGQNVPKLPVMMRSFVLLQPQGPESLDRRLFLVLAGLAFVHWVGYVGGARVGRTMRALPTPAFALLWGASAAATLWLIFPNAQPFIYFQF